MQGTARKEMLDLEDDICRSHNLSFHLVPSIHKMEMEKGDSVPKPHIVF